VEKTLAVISGSSGRRHRHAGRTLHQRRAAAAAPGDHGEQLREGSRSWARPLPGWRSSARFRRDGPGAPRRRPGDAAAARASPRAQRQPTQVTASGSDATGSHHERSEAVSSLAHGAIAISGGRIAAVGSDADVLALAGPGTRRVDLGGRTVLPGFIDAHAHIWKIGHLLTTMADLRRAGSLAEIAARVREAAGTAPAGRCSWPAGYNEGQVGRAAATHPGGSRRRGARPPVSWTGPVATSAPATAGAPALRHRARDTRPAGRGDRRDASGEPTGLLHETRDGLVNARVDAGPTADEYATMIGAASGTSSLMASPAPTTRRLPSLARGVP